MKELSIEEKARRYDEAIKKVNDYYEGKTKLYSDVDKTLDYLFPELKESEDERIKNAIKKAVDYYWSDDTQARTNILSWLEKQGEQKSQDKPALEVWKNMRLEVYQQASGNRHEPNYSDDSTKMFSLTDIDEIFEKVAEKQCEQKETLCDKCRKEQPSHSCQDIIELGRCAVEHPRRGLWDSEKVIKFVKENVREYHKSGVFHVDDFIKDLCKAMEE